MRPFPPGLLVLAGVLIGGSALGAQNPLPQPRPPVAPDTSRVATPADSTRRDTVPLPDSLSPDSFRPQLPPLGAPPGPLPHSGRTVFDRDALWFSGALTLGELLTRIPGVFLVRAGWFGRQEVVHFAGQGASSVELVWDGYALDPIGDDSTGVDLGRINLGLLQRVEVEVLPTVVRVYLFSDDQTVRKARTETSFATGDASTNTYRIRYLNRWKNGTGLGLGVNFLGSSGVATSPGRSSDLTLWVKGSWVPSPRYGVQYQLLSVSVDQDSVLLGDRLAPTGALPSRKVHRTDAVLRGFIASRSDGMGLRLDALVGSARSTDTSAELERHALQGSAILAFRAARWSSELTTRIRDTRTPFELQLRAAASPFAALTVSAYAFTRTHFAGRRSTEAGVVTELRPLAFLTAHGAFRVRNEVGAPAVLSDTAQRVTDFSGGLSLTTGPLDLDLTIAHHGVYAAPLYGSFANVVPAYPSFAVRTGTVSFAFRPTAYLTLAGWYREPLEPGLLESVTSAYEPPHHSRIWATFRSRLLPVLRRGAFDLTVEAALEGWSRGAFGADSSGASLLLKGATIVDYRIELRLLGAAIYWTIRNALAERYSVVPGLAMPRSNQSYGVRWEFTN